MTLIKPFLVIVKSLLFYIFDSLALFNATSTQKNKFELVLLVRQDAIGDFVMWLDTAKEYRKLFPAKKYKILLVGNSSWCDLADELPYWDQVLPIDSKKFKSFAFEAPFSSKHHLFPKHQLCSKHHVCSILFQVFGHFYIGLDF